MAATFLKSQLARLWRSRQRSNDKGFTLAELLVVTLIAGGIVSGLLYLVVELLTADQRDASRNETQRDMQRALDYIGNELREAVYVYPGECLGNTPNTQGGYCPGLSNFLPSTVVSTQSVPILAFWRQKDLPPSVKNACARAASLDDPTISGVNCALGHSYALVVYSLSKANSSSTWTGNARITRYELPQFQYNSSGNAITPVSGYAPPIYKDQPIFRTWPYGGSDTSPVDTRSPAGAPLGGTQTVLTDFVDDGRGAAAAGVTSSQTGCPDDPTTVDDAATLNIDEGKDYSISPATYSFAGSQIRSFYACVSNTPSIDNRNVILYLRGNAFGRPGVNTQNGFVPTLSTQVLSRGILDKNPSQQ